MNAVDSSVFDDAVKLRHLRGRGYTIEPFLNREEVQALSALHQQTTPEVPTDFHVSAFADDVAIKRRIFEGIRNIVAEKLKTLAPGYRLLIAIFVTKKAHSVGGRLGLHADYSLVDHSKDLGLNVWVPLCDVDHTNGCLKVIDGSQAFGHIAANPPNPSPYDHLRTELDAEYMIEVPMKAGNAFLFDTRLLHETEENISDTDRTAVLLNLVPECATPKLYQWNKDNPDQLELYEIDTDFLLNLTPNAYVSNAEERGAKLVEVVDYKIEQVATTDLPKILPRAHPPTLETIEPSPRSSIMGSLRKSLGSLLGRT